ncbi:MAG TPA: formate dehydrogenase accessory protein FdhE [Chloroflexota bacterium]|nr:formate dehydrogenase accessory protein FdhE [Chloroflexota bacterium]
MSTDGGGVSRGEAIRVRLESLKAQSPGMEDAIAFYQQLLPALLEAQDTVSPIAIEREVADARLRSGTPLLVGEDLPLNLEETRYTLLRLCRLVEALPSAKHGIDGDLPRAQQAEAIRSSVESGALDPEKVWDALLSGNQGRLDSIATAHGLHLGMLQLLAQFSLRPSFRGWAESLKESADWSLWERGACPICGSDPGLAELQGKERAPHLRCTNCGADWPYPRVKCAFCGNDEPQSLHIFSLSGEEERRQVQACDRCHGYIKRIATFDPTPVEMLQVEDLAALHLDIMAADKGFRRGTVNR